MTQETCTCMSGRFGVVRMPLAYDVVDRSEFDKRGYRRVQRFTGKTARDRAHRLAHRLQREAKE